ncbi:MAG: substrate-binding domain-containing protein [Ignavibacteriales bacterium]|nr:substrate-binding domain-containing protein [Ignavibacteriales bacterium]
MKIKIFIALLITASIISFFFCNKKEEKKTNKVIGVTLLKRGDVFYLDLEEALKKEAAKNNYELIVTSADFDLGKQIAQIEDFISRKVDAIIVCPVDSKGIGQGIIEANKANIPIFTADIAAQDGKVVAHIASDNIAGGRLAGEYLAKMLNGKGKVAVINQPAITSVLDRVQGFKEAISKYPDIKLVADINGQGVRDRSLQVTADVLQSNPDLTGIFGINDESALGALDAVQQFKKMNLTIVGYDATPPAVDAILKGTALKADVIQKPGLIGETTIQKIKDYFEGKPVPAVVPVAVGIVDKESLDKK